MIELTTALLISKLSIELTTALLISILCCLHYETVGKTRGKTERCSLAAGVL